MPFEINKNRKSITRDTFKYKDKARLKVTV